MRMMARVMERSVPAEVLRRDLHLLGDHIPLGTEQMHPGIGRVVTQPLCIFPAEGNDMCPDIAEVFVHFFLHLGQDNGGTFI